MKAVLGMRNRLPGTPAALVTGPSPRGRAALQWDASLATTSTGLAPTYPEEPLCIGKLGWARSAVDPRAVEVWWVLAAARITVCA